MSISNVFSLESLHFSDALLVAISIPDIGLRDAIVDRLVGLVERIRSGEDGAAVAQTVVLASAIIENDVDWENWLGKTLAEVAARLPLEKEILLGFSSILDAIEIVVPAQSRHNCKS